MRISKYAVTVADKDDEEVIVYVKATSTWHARCKTMEYIRTRELKNMRVTYVRVVSGRTL